jgi:hypothetical protein
VTTSGIQGLYGTPWIDLEPHLDLSPLPALHEEICLAFASIPVDYTGGSHRSMGIVPPGRPSDVGVDYGEVIRGLGDAELETFRQLADERGQFDPARRAELTFGEERDVPLSRRQMLWLKVRFGVYFPWKAYVELIPNRTWGEKATSEGKRFTRLARTFFPKTIAFVESLPFSEIGRCNVMGLESFDHGTVHRDGDPAEQTEPDEFITFVPGGDKRLFLWDDEARRELPIDARAYWFNDFDYHGVAPSPRFRYSVRVDGRFRPDFKERVLRAAGHAA